jgi:thymidylate synthase (FAD)
MKATLISWTEFAPPMSVDWDTDAVDPGSALIEFAGRACYQSWTKPNPDTATNAGYLRHILEVGHLSVLEHAYAGFYFTGVSRSETHEKIRHRHFSYSELSQRYVPLGDARFVMPELYASNPELRKVFEEATRTALGFYDKLLELGEDAVADRPGLSRTQRFKEARQAARSVMPNATETRIVMSGNYRAWRHFIHMRATQHADVEIRGVAVEVLRALQDHAPAAFGDFKISTLPDGTEVAASVLGVEN